MAVGELFLGEGLGRHRHVLLLATRIGEAHVDELHLLVLDHLQYVIGRHRHLKSPKRVNGKRGRVRQPDAAMSAESMPIALTMAVPFAGQSGAILPDEMAPVWCADEPECTAAVPYWRAPIIQASMDDIKRRAK